MWAVSRSRSPAARHRPWHVACEKLEAEFGATFAEWVMAEVRTIVLTDVADPTRRRELLDSFADWSWLARIRAADTAAVKAAMLSEIQASRGT